MGSVHLGLTMKFFALAFFAAAASAKDIRLNLLAPPTELEYGFCDGSPEPITFDVMSVAPFPILVQNGATITLQVQISLLEEVAVGAQVDLNLVLEGIIPIKIPCLDIEGLHISLMCGGSIVGSNKVITAGHCCDGMSAGKLGVEVGSHNLYEDDPDQESFAVSDVGLHEDYDSWNINNDICMLTLEG